MENNFFLIFAIATEIAFPALSNLIISPKNGTELYVSSNNCAILNVTQNAGNGFLQISINNKSIQHWPSPNLPLSITLTPDNFSSYGSQDLVLSNIQSFFWYPVFYEEVIDLISVEPSQSVFLDKTTTNFTINVSKGSNLLLNMFAVSQTSFRYLTCSKSQKIFVVPYDFNTCNKLELEFSLFNTIYKKSVPKSIVIVPNVDKFDVVFQSFSIVPPSTLEINVTYPGCDLSKSNVTVKLLIDNQLGKLVDLKSRSVSFSVQNFRSVGTVNVSIVIKSGGDSASFSQNILVISNATLQPEKTEYFLGDTVRLQLNQSTIALEEFRINISNSINEFYFVNKSKFIDLPLPKDTKTSVYNITWTLSSPYFIKSGSVKVSAYGKLTNVSMEKKSITLPNGLRKFNISVESTGSVSGFCLLSYGDGTSYNATNLTFPINFINEKNYTKVDNYNSTVNCYVPLSSVGTSALTEVTKFELKDFSFNYSTVVLLKSNAEFFLEYRQNLEPPPDFVSIEWDFGDGNSLSKKTLTSYNQSHTYSIFGNYSGFLTLSTDEQSRKIPFDIQAGVFDFKVENSSTLIINAIKCLFVPNPFYIMANSSLTYKVDFLSGNNHLKSCQETHFSSENSVSFDCQISHIGAYSVFTKVQSATWTESRKQDDLLVRVMNRVTDLQLGLPKRLPSYLDLKINITSGKQNLEFLNLTCTFTLSNGQSVNKTGDLKSKSPIEAEFQNLRVGSLDVDVNCFNELSSQKLPKTTLVVYSDCFTTNAFFMEKNRDPSDPIELQNSRENVIKSDVQIKSTCEAMQLSYVWIYRNQTFENSNSSFSIQINEVPGLYRIQLNVSLNNTVLTDHVYVNVSSAPLEAILKGGLIQMTTKDDVLLDAETLSYDPIQGQGKTTGLNFSWSCLISNLKQSFDPNFKLDNSQFSSCPQTTFQPLLTNLGKLKIPSSAVETEKWYVFKVRVWKEKRTASTQQAVYVTQLKMIPLQIGCVLNCLPKLSTNQEAIFKVEFSKEASAQMDALKETPTFEWNLSRLNTKQIKKEVSITGSHDGPQVNFLSGSLEEDVQYFLGLKMTNLNGYSDSYAMLEFKTNQVPQNGSCTVNPKKGTNGDIFNVNCSGWQDPDGIQKYVVIFKTGQTKLVVDESFQAISSGYRLPVGNKDDDYKGILVIQIYDNFQAFYEMNITLQIKIDKNVGEALLNSSSLDDQMTNNPAAVMRNAGNVISSINTVKIPVVKDSVSNIEEMSEAKKEAMFSQDASKVNEQWDAIVNGLSNEKDQKQQQVDKVMAEMTQFMTSQIESKPPSSEMEIQEKSEVLQGLFENPKFSHMESVQSCVGVADLLGNVLTNFAKKRPIDPGFQNTIHSVISLVGTLFDQLTPDEPLSPEPMTMEKMRKKLEESYPDPNSSMSIEERSFLALKNYQQQKITKDKQLDASKSAVPKLMKTISQISETMSYLTVPEGGPLEQKTKNLEIANWKIIANSSTTNFQLSSGQGLRIGDLKETNIDMVVFKKNPFINDAGGEDLKDVISFSQKSETGKTPEEAPSGVVIVSFTHKKIEWKLIEPPQNSSEMILHKFYCRSPTEKTCVKVKPTDKKLGYTVYMRSEEYPTAKEFNYRTVVEPANLTNDVYTICFPEKTILKAGYIYIGLLPFEAGGHHRSKRSAKNQTQSSTNAAYQFGSIVAGCSVLDNKNQKWTSDHCKPSYNQIKNLIECHCTHPVSTTFSNSFYVPPNSIDFSTVFSKFDLINNGAVFGVVIAFISLYLILLIVTRHYDRKDFIKWSIVPLVDNDDSDPFWYVISVYTGLQFGSGTKSRISFKVAGDFVETQVHSLSDGHQKEFKTGSILKFLMSTNESLGDIQYLHIWHDNSGHGDGASWYLNKIEITDLQSGESYVFLCNTWLAVEEGDGAIARVLPVSTGNELLSFNNKFFEHTRQKITDEHIWLSIVFRPLESPFNRKKRLSTAFALLFLTMISNAMFYSKPVQVIQLGPIRFSLTMIWTSFMGIVISTLPIIIIMTLFKKSKSKPKKHNKKSSSVELLEKSFASTEDLIVTNPKKPENLTEDSEELILPWFCAYIAWILVILSILSASFFVILYSQEWGKEKSEEWLTTFFLSFFESCFIVDPLKVVVVSIILSFFSKKIIKNKIAKKKIDKTSNRRETLQSSWTAPLGQKLLKQARVKRCSDLRMREVIQDLFLYIVFLWVIYSLSNDNRDPNAFKQSQQLDKLFYISKQFKQIQTEKQLFQWINSTFFPNFFPQRDYKGLTLQPLRKLFASDQTNFRMGPARFRMLRKNNETCKIPYIGTVNCYDNYNIITEDTNGYCIKWKSPPCPPNEEATHLTFPAWNFTSSAKIWGLPYMGIYSLYGGGGYILNLEINLPISIKMLDEIYRNLWIDRKTRAVFIEFTLYNANVNLFTYAILLAEIPNIGQILPYTFFYSFKALPDENNGMVFVCQLLFVVFILMMLIRSFIRMFHMKWTFFQETWYILDFLSSLGCGATVGMYVMRSMMISQAQESLKADPKKFINFYHIVIWDQIFVTLMAVLVFLSTIRFLRILGYNKRISAISMVITSAKKDMSGFFLLFIIIFWTFSSYGYLTFGRNLAHYRSIWHSMTAMYMGMLGQTNFSSLRHTRHAIGPLFYLLFVFIFIFFLLRMIESILNESIQKVNSQLNGKQDSISRYLYDQMPKYIRKILFPKQPKDFEVNEPEFSDVQKVGGAENNFLSKVPESVPSGKNLNLSSFDMMYDLINKNFEDCINDLYVENGEKKMKF